MSRSLRQKLLRWYDANARDLPWRRTRDPYAIWVSEIMCQQTRVDTVVPYFDRFMARFPTASDLAEASEDDVLSMWSGLGYYRRARLLHRGVQEVVSQYGGEVPQERESRLALPGVGRYTAGAIGSIAFDEQEAVVDGNVARVFGRLHRIDEEVGTRENDRRVWGYAEDLVKGARPGDLNQALMELGATVCTPTNPGCGRCPLKRDCESYEHSEQNLYPKMQKKTPPVKRDIVAVVAVNRGRCWLVRSDEALFGGLWNVPCSNTERSATDLLREQGLSAPGEVELCGEVAHTLSHRRLQTKVFKASVRSRRSLTDAKWVSESELQTLGISTYCKKILGRAGVFLSPS
ncbi:MAG: A/G-specific adenine glycosylase [Polyangiales bacterium]